MGETASGEKARVAVLIPCYNEAVTIGKVVKGSCKTYELEAARSYGKMQRRIRRGLL